MADVSKADKNFVVDTKIKCDNLLFKDIEEKPFKIYGAFREGEFFRRIPEKLVEEVVCEGEWMKSLCAGGRVRFKTNSEFVAINAIMGNIGTMPHFAFSGSIGLDIYEKTEEGHKCIGCFVPPIDTEDGYESIVHFGTEKMRDITIYFPTYSGLKKLYVGIDENAQLMEGSEYKYNKPVLYYGSSITHGGCSSRAGTTYEGFVTNDLDVDHINLGFSGNARGQEEIAEYIAGLDISAFVYDYDYNAPNTEHLEKTHEKFFKIIREKRPNLPVIMMPRPKVDLNEDEKKRRDIILKTYNNAVASGDKNVYYISGDELLAVCGNEGLVDRCHPTDLGFFSMAQAVKKVLKKIL